MAARRVHTQLHNQKTLATHHWISFSVYVLGNSHSVFSLLYALTISQLSASVHNSLFPPAALRILPLVLRMCQAIDELAVDLTGCLA